MTLTSLDTKSMSGHKPHVLIVSKNKSSNKDSHIENNNNKAIKQ